MSRLKAIITNIEWSQISPAVIARYVLGIISVVNIILDKAGALPISVSESTVYSICSIAFALIMIIVNTYKNNSTSIEAMIADRVMAVIRASEEVDTKQPVIDQIEQVLNDVQNQIAQEREDEIDYPDDDNDENED